MGCYINMDDKELWLFENSDAMFTGRYGEGLKSFPPYGIFKKGSLPVVLVDNGRFKAAGVAYNEREYEAFTQPDDPRPREVFSVPVDKLMAVSDLREYLGDSGRDV